MRGAAPPTRYSFPILTPEEIIEQCKAVGLDITKADIELPMPARVLEIYSFLDRKSVV